MSTTKLVGFKFEGDAVATRAKKEEASDRVRTVKAEEHKAKASKKDETQQVNEKSKVQVEKVEKNKPKAEVEKVEKTKAKVEVEKVEKTKTKVEVEKVEKQKQEAAVQPEKPKEVKEKKLWETVEVRFKGLLNCW